MVPMFPVLNQTLSNISNLYSIQCSLEVYSPQSNPNQTLPKPQSNPNQTYPNISNLYINPTQTSINKHQSNLPNLYTQTSIKHFQFIYHTIKLPLINYF